MAKRKNSSQKGSGFERKVCKELSLWWTHGQRDDIFYRASGSGARATSRHRVGKETANAEGDICYTDADGKRLLDVLCIELKCGYAYANLMDFIETNQSETQFMKFWKQVTESAEHAGTFPFLIWKRDRKNALCVFTEGFFNWLVNNDAGGVLYMDCAHFKYKYEGIQYRFFCIKFSDFLEYFKPELFQGEEL